MNTPPIVWNEDGKWKCNVFVFSFFMNTFPVILMMCTRSWLAHLSLVPLICVAKLAKMIKPNLILTGDIALKVIVCNFATILSRVGMSLMPNMLRRYAACDFITEYRTIPRLNVNRFVCMHRLPMPRPPMTSQVALWRHVTISMYCHIPQWEW